MFKLNKIILNIYVIYPLYIYNTYVKVIKILYLFKYVYVYCGFCTYCLDSYVFFLRNVYIFQVNTCFKKPIQSSQSCYLLKRGRGMFGEDKQ